MRSRRTLAIRPMGQQTSEINVTPLVDVVLVLLIIFMVLTASQYWPIRMSSTVVHTSPNTSAAR